MVENLGVWFDMTEGFEDRMREATQYVNQYLGFVSEYSTKGYNRSQFTSMCLRILKNTIETFTPEYLAKLEEQYREHRTHKTSTTSVNFMSDAIASTDYLAEWLAKNTKVKHVYHGGSPNRKLLMMMAIYHVFNEMERTQQG